MRLMFHVQHLLGIGHHRRAERLVQGLAEAGFAVTVATGGPPVEGEDWSGAERVQLPPARADGSDFRQLLDEDGRPVDDAWKQHRRDALLAEFRRLRPDVLLLEAFPFARRQLRFELVPLLEAAAAASPRPLVATSVRDILVAKPDPRRVAEVVETVRRRIDLVLVHGDPSVVTLDATFPAAAELADRTVYTGYIAPPAPRPATSERLGVVVSVGGGAVGVELLLAAAAARPLSAARDRPWRLLTGPMMPAAEAARVAAAATPGLVVERHRADFTDLLAGAELSISQAGYNTVLDLLRAGPRAVLVPFAAPGETEQTRRAELLAAGGRAILMPEAGLDAYRLADAVDRALAGPPPPAWPVDLDGARRTGAVLRQARAA